MSAEIFTPHQLDCLDSELEIAANNYFASNNQNALEKELDEIGDQHARVFKQKRHSEIRNRFKAIYLHGEKK